MIENLFNRIELTRDKWWKWYIMIIYHISLIYLIHLLLHFMLHPDIQYSDFRLWCMICMLLHFMLNPDIWYSDLWQYMLIMIYHDHICICYFTSCYILTFNIQIYDLWYNIIMIYHMLLHFMLHPDIWYSDLWWCMIIMIYHNHICISYFTSCYIQYSDVWWYIIII
mgnify:CR=1 FL=1